MLVWVNEEGMGVLLAELDPVSYQQVRKALDVEYDRLWRGDGGRDGKPDQIRTTPQRMADAFVALLTDTTRRGPGSTRHQLIAIADIERLRPTTPPASLKLLVEKPYLRPCSKGSCAPPLLPGLSLIHISEPTRPY